MQIRPPAAIKGPECKFTTKTVAQLVMAARRHHCPVIQYSKCVGILMPNNLFLCFAHDPESNLTRYWRPTRHIKRPHRPKSSTAPKRKSKYPKGTFVVEPIFPDFKGKA
jgi:hypothetical protein